MILNNEYKYTEIDKREIINQIDKIHETFNIKQSVLIDLILYSYLSDRIRYGITAKDINCIITDISFNKPDLIIQRLKELIDLNILKLTNENNINYYELNYEIFDKLK